ncbi:DinB family protein [Deinococcus aluminii]|uniref:Damage-inducible protein DinB n=1 Tax=Deinococcus aluminii TaxID=1656885 RepID=A0ABP9X965_9DEIO
MTQADTASATLTPALMTPESLLAHWQGHRRLTRRVIEAFPEDQLFTFTAAPPMRSFGEMAWEVVGLVDYLLKGLDTGDWSWTPPSEQPAQDLSALLAAWDAQTPQLEAALPAFPIPRYLEKKDMAWGYFSPLETVQYLVDNEIHHRGQGYVYLRALGIEPPPFYER